jgi:hypothetical protein
MLQTVLTALSFIDEPYESKYVRKLTKQIEDFYRATKFIPAPNMINLFDARCVQRVADDLTVFGKNSQELRNKVIEFL